MTKSYIDFLKEKTTISEDSGYVVKKNELNLITKKILLYGL